MVDAFALATAASNFHPHRKLPSGVPVNSPGRSIKFRDPFSGIVDLYRLERKSPAGGSEEARK
jgi:hypothetical protein